MKKVMKWLAYFLLSLVAILLIGALLLYSHKEEILTSINAKLKERINGDVNIGDVHITILRHFPNVSIALEDIYVHGPQYEKYKHPFLRAQWVDVNVDLFKLLREEISIKSIYIEDGEFFVFRAYDGYTNLRVFKKKRVPSDPTREKVDLPDLAQLNLIDVKITYVDSLKKKTFAVNLQRTSNSITSRDSSTVISIAGRMTFDRLMLNSAKGSFLKDKSVIANLNLELDAAQKNILVRPSILKFEKSMVRLSGLFTLSQPGQFQLGIASDELDYKEGLSILNDSLVKKLEKYQVEKPLEIEVNLKGALEPGVKPAVDLTFAFSDSKVTTPILNMENMTIRGSFINHVDRTLPNDAQNSQLHFGLLKGVVNNLPVEAEVTLTDLRDPALLLNATFNVNLKDLNTHLDTTKLKMIEGNFISKFTYTGKLQEYLDDSRTRYEGMLAGKATITNGKLNYIARKININSLNATFDFTEKRFTIQDLKLIANKNSVSVNGLMTDFIPFFTSPQQSCKVKLNITSPRLDVSGFTQRRKIERSKSAKAASKQRVSDLVEKLNESLEFDLDFKINEFVNKNFRATQLKGNLIMANNQFILKNAGMDFAKGKVGFNLKVTNLQKKVNPIYLSTKMKDVDLKEFFYAFNDFNQKTFSHNHVEGRLSLDLDLRAEVDDKLDFLTKDLDGVAQFTITDGRLKDFEPMQRLSNFLFKGRDFSDVQFGEITSDINMSGTQMHVSRMEVESTVVTMFIEGRYDLKDSSDLSIQIPLSNLKKRDQDIPPENVGVDSKVGPSVYLRVKPDKTGKNTISYDPFKKFRKKKKNGSTA
jgi:hypothetical protein